MATKNYHVMVFPWLAFGHMLPFLELSKKLAAKGIRVSFVSTPKNLQRLPPIPSSLGDRIKLLEIPLPSIGGLPVNCEATVDLQPEEIQYLKKAYDKLALPFEELLLENLPDLILIDFAPFWIPEIAAKYGVSTAFFSVYTASTLAYLGSPVELKNGTLRTRPEHFVHPPPWFNFHSLVAHRPDYASTMMHNTHCPDASGVSSGQRIAKIVEGCKFVVVRSCNEFEEKYINLIEDLYQRPVLPIGILSPAPETGTQPQTDSGWSHIFRWLDKQKSKSVVFVGFGSEYKMPNKEIHELACALELSEQTFLWILRKPEGVEYQEVLPTGFLSRVSNQGIVSLGWAPQQDILAHPSIGGCLFHSGWGTIIEALSFGHRLILIPMVADQGLNAKLLVEKEIGHEVPRNEDGSFCKDIVANSIRLVMNTDEGEKLRSRAAQVQKIFSDHRLHDSYVDQFIQHIKRLEFQKGNEK
ncbi:putative UDP-rhamnose:rhamnosyltransferase 1 [Nicotiana tomentosiformis]|uniref:putative UDP-rhamnose:rhamnosyltransferase 1 n=1 Tax=Nicotiana tomentosiformis TaxID=4098 RepID=UPI00051B110A|nr:putative UDP-rhamnose:rhamnosyltransferase 1 [Nicotiana tomentosiformis]